MAFASRNRRHREPVIINRPGRHALRAVVAAAAAVALADGVAQPGERRSMIRFLRDNGLIGILGRGKTIALYQSEIDSQQSGSDVSARLHRIAGQHGALLAAAGAWSVAVSDGVMSPEENATLARLQAALGVSPGRPVLG